MESKYKSNFYYGLNWIRGLAMIMVLLFHMAPAIFPGGFLGVNTFFVLSGFLLYTKDMDEKRCMTKGSFAVGFYKRRIRRLFPMLWFMVIVTTVLCTLLTPDIQLNPHEVMASLFGYENIWQVQMNASYFTRITNQSPFTHLWSTAIELQFYLIWPVLVAVMKIIRQYSKVFLTIWLVLITGLLTGLMPFFYSPAEDVSAIYYSSLTRVFAIFIGLLVAHMYWDWGWFHGKAHQKNLLVFSILVSLQIIAMFVCEGQSAGVYLGGMATYSLISGWMILLVMNEQFFFKDIEKYMISRLGEGSYEIYLWQYPIIFAFGYFKVGFGSLRYGIEIVVIVFVCIISRGLLHIVLKKVGKDIMKNKKYKITYLGVITLIILTVVSTLGIKGKIEGVRISTKAEAQSQVANVPENQTTLEEHLSDAVNEKNSKADTESSDSNAADQNLESNQSVTFVGDSVMLGASSEIKNAVKNSNVDAKESRQVVKAIPIIDEMKKSNSLGDSVVIALGTNGVFSKSTGQALIDDIGADHDIYWVTAYGKHLAWQNDVNATIRALADANQNVHVISWDEKAVGNDAWFYNDGIHLNGEGRQAYASLLKAAIVRGE